MLDNIASPYGLAVIAYAFFLFSCLIPPSVYSGCIGEPDLMFLDPATILFYTLCVAAFLAGVWFFERLFPPRPFVESSFEVRVSPTVFLALPLVLGAVVVCISSVLLLKRNPLAIGLLLAQQGGSLKAIDGTGLEHEGTLTASALFLIGVVWWASWRLRQLDLSERGKRTVRFALLLAVVAEFISATLNLVRHPFVLLISGLAVCYMLQRTFRKQLSWKALSKTVAVFLFGGAIYFFLVAELRGSSSDQTEMFVGYTAASYNRLAAVLNGRLQYQYAGKGIYLSNFLLFNNSFNRFIPFGSYMNAPEYFDWLLSDFSSVGRAGLNSSLIFCGTFGDIYTELGWFSPLYVFGYGLLYGLVWRWMKQGRLLGIILYPYFAYVVLFWFSTNALFEADTAALILVAIILQAYESLFVREALVLAPAGSSPVLES